MSRAAFLLALLVVLGASVALTIIRYPPPKALAADAPADQFSAGRALRTLDTLVGDGIPHPVGSEQNAVVRQRVVDGLNRAGWDTQLQHATVDQWYGKIDVVNVLARLKGTQTGPAVMLAAHYDSVDEGPGAADDGAAVAALIEIAGMLAADPQPRNDVIILITDGEEAGLLGAQAFVNEHPWAADVGVVVNLEARGTSGPSLMFQTSTEDTWLIERMAEAVDHPRTGSVFVEVYQRLPNNTDFTVFQRYGMAGYNFAFIGDAENYHTANDTLENLDLRSMQHHGENTLGLARVLSQVDLSEVPPGRSVYFDVLGLFIVHWPRGIGPAVASAAALLVVLAGIALLCRRLLGWGRWALGILLAIVVLIASVGLDVGLHKLMAMSGALPSPWVQRPWLIESVFWIVALVPAAIVGVLGRRLGPWAFWTGVWTVWALAGIAMTFWLAGAAYLLIVPAILAGLAGLVTALVTQRPLACGPAVLVGVAAAALLWFPLDRLFYDALGLGVAVLNAGPAGLLATTLLPAFALLAAPRPTPEAAT